MSNPRLPFNVMSRVRNALAATGRTQHLPESTTTLTVTDDDSAATNGTDVNIVVNDDGFFGHLESTTASNANTYFDDSNGDAIKVTDNDSPGGVALYFDEDANWGERFLAVLPDGIDHCFVLTNGGNSFKVTDSDDAATDGVAVHIDDDGATASARLLFISPTDADGTEYASKEAGVGYHGLNRATDV